MNEETALRLQAWLDGELPPEAAAAPLQLVQTDREAAALVRELKLTRTWLAGNELRRPVPESREFYWSKIERDLEPPAQDPAPTPAPSLWSLGWLRWLVPTALTASLAALLWWSSPPKAENAQLAPAEVENPLEDQGSITFRSESEQMTVFWVNSL